MKMFDKGNQAYTLAEVGRLLREYRRRLRLSRRELAKRLDCRIETINRIEAGKPVHSDVFLAYLTYMWYPYKAANVINNTMHNSRPIDDQFVGRDIWTTQLFVLEE